MDWEPVGVEESNVTDFCCVPVLVLDRESDRVRVIVSSSVFVRVSTSEMVEDWAAVIVK